jgi:hypothetical protein
MFTEMCGLAFPQWVAEGSTLLSLGLVPGSVAVNEPCQIYSNVDPAVAMNWGLLVLCGVSGFHVSAYCLNNISFSVCILNALQFLAFWVGATPLLIPKSVLVF